MLGINKTVVCDTALGDCGVRYCPGGVLCTILPWWNVVYDTALEECGVLYCPGEAVVYNTTSRRGVHP